MTRPLPDLPLTDTTMTTCGVTWGELMVRYHTHFDLQHPSPVGEDEQGNLAWPLFPTWACLEMLWSDAAQLAHLVARAIDPLEDKASLLDRLLHAAWPPGFTPTRPDWQSHAQLREDILDQGADAFTSTLVLRRSEAADLVKILVRTLAPTTPIDDGLLGKLVNAAVPMLLFRESNHTLVHGFQVRTDIVQKGRAALPAFLIDARETTA